MDGFSIFIAIMVVITVGCAFIITHEHSRSAKEERAKADSEEAIKRLAPDIERRRQELLEKELALKVKIANDNKMMAFREERFKEEQIKKINEFQATLAEERKRMASVLQAFLNSVACLYSPWMLSRLFSAAREQRNQSYDFSAERHRRYFDFGNDDDISQIEEDKTNARIGEEFEDEVATWLKCGGYKIIPTGRIYKEKDLGRDLLARHPDTGKTLVVQCKRWRAERRIAPKVLFYLFATSILFAAKELRIEVRHHTLPNGQHENALKILEDAKVTPVLVSTASLSPMDAALAQALGVRVINDILRADIKGI